MTRLLFAGRVNSPLGDLLVYLTDDRLAELRIVPAGEAVPDAPSGDPVFDAVRAQLEAYFRGESHGFDVPLAPAGSAFDLRVWAAIRSIPFGRTASYFEIAARIGHPGAARAVGSANARNPLMIVTPCHR